MNDNNDNKQQQMSIDIKPEVARGVFSNLALISHSPSEFVIDFAAILPGMPKPEVVSRIVMTPEHVKMLLGALSDNIKKYESQFGQITVSPRPGSAQGPTINLAELADLTGGSKS